MIARCRRSALYVPASNLRAMQKAASLDCDVVIVDLEDAVAPEAKSPARAAAVHAIRDRIFGDREVALRINGLDTQWGAADIDAVRAARPDAMLAPKIGSVQDVARYAATLGGGGAAISLWAMIETCQAVLNLRDIAGAGGLGALVLGSNDLLAEMGAVATPGREALTAALSLTVIAARAHGLVVLDGVLNDFSYEAALSAECDQGAALGFDGKTLIHPSQIAVCNRAFSPTPRAVAHARAVAAAFADPKNAGQGVLVVEGRMTERLHLAQAQRILAIHEAASHADLA